MDKKEPEEYRKLVVAYLEEHEKYKELLLQFSSVGQLEIGKPIPSPGVCLTPPPIRRLGN